MANTDKEEKEWDLLHDYYDIFLEHVSSGQSSYDPVSCNGKFTFKSKDNKEAPRREYKLGKLTGALEYQMGMTYQALNLCQAPATFDTRYRDPNDASVSILPNDISSLIASYLHLAYGDIIIPGVWKVNPSTRSITLQDSYYYMPIKNATPASSLNTIQEVIRYIKYHSNERVHVMYISVPSDTYPGMRHAMMVTFVVLNHRRIQVYVTDPNMHYHSELIEAAKDALRPFTDTGRVYTLMKKNLIGKFQAMNTRAGYSQIDRKGYCAAWTLLLMELTARTLLLNRDATLKDIASFHLPTPLSSGHASAWRKFIVDYLFSRIIDAYALARKLRKKTIVKYLNQDVIRKYIDDINITNIVSGIMTSIPGFIERGPVMVAAHKEI